MADYKERIRVHIAGKEFSVVGGDFHDMLAAVKQINGRRFVSELKVWQLPGTAEEVQHQLEINGYYLEGGQPIADAAAPAAPSPPSRGDRVRIMVGGHPLAVAGGSFQEMLAAVKNLPGRRYDGETKMWEIPGEVGVIKGMLQAAGFDLEGAANIPQAPIPPMAALPFSSPGEDVPPFAPPDWDEDNLPPPPNPPAWGDDELIPPPDYDLYDQPPPFDLEPLPGQQKPSGSTSAKIPGKQQRGGDRIRVRVGVFPLVMTGGSFQEMLAFIKNIPGRRFNGQDKVWEIPDEVGLAGMKQMIKTAGFEVETG
ncbi:MAG: hypothetical protein JW953_16815 [Anaerolineae bacterium]|nr:hypothetical protein [Anaerolineae bacterium]